MPCSRAVQSCLPLLRVLRRLAEGLPVAFLLLVTLICLSVPQSGFCQDESKHDKINQTWKSFRTADSILSAVPLQMPSSLSMDAGTENEESSTIASPSRKQVESELVVEGLVSYGHYKIFASGSDCKLYTAGVEYDRHSWGYLLKARVDYVAEFLPVVLLSAPATQNIWGQRTTLKRKVVPGIGISPIGFRMLWRDKKSIEPYLTAKGGVLGFPQKVLSQKATYVNFSLQSAFGVNVKMNERWGLRLGLFSDFHFSNAFIVPVNPGLDVMNANLGLSYHF